MIIDKEIETVCFPKSYIDELEKKAKDCDYFRGRVEGLEYVIDTLEDILKSKGVER